MSRRLPSRLPGFEETPAAPQQQDLLPAAAPQPLVPQSQPQGYAPQQPVTTQVVNVHVDSSSSSSSSDHGSRHGPRKSVAVSLLLTFLFGPFGMFYTTVAGGWIMTAVTIIAALLTCGVSLIVTWPICMIWGAMAVGDNR